MDAGHFEVGSAVGTANQITLVDIKFVDFDFGIAFRTGRHTYSLEGLVVSREPPRAPRHRGRADFGL